MSIREPTKTDLKKRTDDEKRGYQGRTGETIIANYYIEQGKKVLFSVDQHDDNKDLTIEGYTVEVKTMVPFFSEDAFSFRVSQLDKCKNVDIVYFISVPADGKTHFSFGKVYRIKSDKMKYSFYRKSFGERGSAKMVKVPIKQEGMQEVFELTEEQKLKLQEYSTSSLNKVTL